MSLKKELKPTAHTLRPTISKATSKQQQTPNHHPRQHPNECNPSRARRSPREVLRRWASAITATRASSRGWSRRRSSGARRRYRGFPRTRSPVRPAATIPSRWPRIPPGTSQHRRDRRHLGVERRRVALQEPLGPLPEFDDVARDAGREGGDPRRQGGGGQDGEEVGFCSAGVRVGEEIRGHGGGEDGGDGGEAWVGGYGGDEGVDAVCQVGRLWRGFCQCSQEGERRGKVTYLGGREDPGGDKGFDVGCIYNVGGIVDVNVDVDLGVGERDDADGGDGKEEKPIHDISRVLARICYTPSSNPLFFFKTSKINQEKREFPQTHTRKETRAKEKED